MNDLTDKIALVTGASRGIGKAIALRLAAQGAQVIGTATTDSGASKIDEYLQAVAPGTKSGGHRLDVCDSDSIEQLLKTMQGDIGAPHILVNNAGITQDGLLLRMKDEQWHSVIDTNLSSVYRMSRACLRGMMKARWGRIITIGSVVGATGTPGQANYCAAKAGLEGFTKALAREVASRGITANVVSPGFIETDMTQVLAEDYKASLLSQIPIGRMGKPEDIATAVGFLASPEAEYMTGVILPVNGGMLMP